MPLRYRDAAKMDARRSRTIDLLSCSDNLHVTLGRMVCQKGIGKGFEARVAYCVRKRVAIRACYFLQRYGRDYYARPVQQ